MATNPSTITELHQPRARLHDLACQGPTPTQGCVCAQTPIRKPEAVLRHLEAADEVRRRASDLITGIEALTAKLAGLPVIPLDLLDRYQRAIVHAHVANQQRVSGYSEAALLRLEGDDQ